jgi:AraC-like DNA-binding protein
MYSINGDFGKVRHIPFPPGHHFLPVHELPVPFLIASGGWHQCNDKYCISRSAESADQHLLLFSISDGGCIQLEDGSVVSLPASSAAWLAPGCNQCYYTAPNQQWEFYWLHLLDSAALMLPDIFPPSHYITLSYMDNVCQELEALLRNRQKNLRDFQLETSRRFSSIYHMMLGASSHAANLKQGDPIVLDIIQVMETDLTRDWDLPFLSAQYYISVPQLIRRFKAETGFTPHSYLICLRLQSAEMYLQYTGMTVEQISRQTGFASTSNFIMQFRRYYGCSPQKYRESH